MIFVLNLAMNTIVFGLFISVFAVNGILSSCNETKQVVSFCGSSCFRSVQPILDHTRLMNEEVHNCNNTQKTNISDKVINIEVQLQSILEEKQKQIIRVIDQISETHTKLEAIEKRLKVEDTLEERIGQQLTNHYEFIETELNKTSSSIIEGSSSLEKQVNSSLENFSNCIKAPRNPLFNQIGGKYYYIEHAKRVNWFVAAQTCLSLGGYLVSLQNEVELNAVMKDLNSGVDYWIGINDLGTKGDYRSMRTGLKANYLKWVDGKPNNLVNNEHCVELWKSNHLMNDENCKSQRSFICESAY